MTATLALPARPGADAEPRRFTLSTTAWRRIALGALLVATAITYLWNITINGMGNGFYAGAAQAGSKNWEALLFGSVDPNNFITVDKPPVSQWVMGLSGQIFGFSSASMLVPEALMAVGAVALLYGAVRRIAGTGAGLLAGAAFALTPVVALMFRYNNPDAVMVLLMMFGAYCTVRALERASVKWIMLAGAALGFAFLAKMLEGLMVAPAIGLVYLLVAPTSMRGRLLHVAAAAAACMVSAGWFVALTLLWPASSRPYLAGSTDNNFMNLVIGYNGLARILGRNHAAPQTHAGAPAAVDFGQHGGFGGFGRQNPGLTRLFTGEFGFEMGWLLPAALLGLVFVLAVRARAPRTDLVRGGAVLFGGWLLVDGLVLSYMKGMVHPYYCLSVVPAVAALVAIGGREMWLLRDRLFGRLALAATILVTGAWSWWLLGRNADWLPALRWVILAVTVVAVAVLLVGLAADRRRVAAIALGVGVLAAAAGSGAYAFATIGQSHNGGGAQVGPAQADRGHGRPGGDDGDNVALDNLLKATDTKWSAAVNGSSAAAGYELATNTAVMAIGGFGGSDPVPSLTQFRADVAAHQIGYYIAPGNHGGPGRGNQHADITAWVAANFTPKTVGSDTVYDLTSVHSGE
ncbi:mannosyltransferase [Mycolicibacterium aromaticivorans JS19b1 = JCM 16368]|uniref:Mannosyltransferase n=2 Tax=Mycolicibacterium aromaticivorans TaxID=318425 RepID=A0A064CLI1_9MYCO|nr:glycosyltransferase family 39 protein [Mycolicibacterium aromaticivorans]KDE99662.1 mannosyltransferase [Mycolicibacterium aromaticivorans JS19b1 = JCM 16368]